MKVDESKLNELYEKIISKVNIDKSRLKKIKYLSDIKQIIENGEIELVQSIISSMGELILDYLFENELVENELATMKTTKGLNSRLFNFSEVSYLLNLVPIFRFIKKGK